MKYKKEISKALEKLSTRPVDTEKEWVIFKCYFTKTTSRNMWHIKDKGAYQKEHDMVGRRVKQAVAKGKKSIQDLCKN